MSRIETNKTNLKPSSSVLLPWLVLLFAFSGCAALIHEIVWFQLLQLVIGSSGVSLGLLLAAFMGGMCLGSIALARIVSKHHHPLRVYAWLELGIALFGLLVLFGMPLVNRLYLAVATPGIAGILLRGIIAAMCLLPPTILMGASLPAVARWVEATPEGVSWLGFFYGGNIAGAVFGVLLAGFYLLRVHQWRRIPLPESIRRPRCFLSYWLCAQRIKRMTRRRPSPLHADRTPHQSML